MRRRQAWCTRRKTIVGKRDAFLDFEGSFRQLYPHARHTPAFPPSCFFRIGKKNGRAARTAAFARSNPGCRRQQRSRQIIAGTGKPSRRPFRSGGGIRAGPRRAERNRAREAAALVATLVVLLQE